MQYTGETAIQAQVRLDLGLRPDVKLFRNNVGMLKDKNGQYVRYGLMEGSADLIGWRSTVITPDMVGMTMARFLSIEMKRLSGGRRGDHQKTWANVVRRAGGLAGFARSTEEAMAIIEGRV